MEGACDWRRSCNEREKSVKRESEIIKKENLREKEGGKVVRVLSENGEDL